MLVGYSRIGSHVRRLATENGSLARGVHFQAGMLRLTQHPAQGKLGKLALRLRIPTTYIRMHAREPNLLDVLLRVRGRAQQVLAEERPSLVDRHRVSDNVDIWVVGDLSEGEMNRTVDPAH